MNRRLTGVDHDQPLRSLVPAAYARMALDLGQRWGLTEAEMLGDTPIRTDLLEQVDVRVSGRNFGRLLHNIVKLSRREDLGFALGLQPKPTSHGFLGYAMMSSATVREVVELGVRFLRVRLSDIYIVPRADGSTLVINVMELIPLGVTRRIMVEAFFTMFCSHLQFLTGSSLRGLELCFEWPEPRYFEHYRDRLPPVRWNEGSNCLRLSSQLLDAPIVTADVGSARQAIKAVENELARLEQRPRDIAEQVRTELRPGADGYPRLHAVAAQLCMSASTLKRRLQARSLSFQQLLDEARQRDALQLLHNNELTLAEISRRVGFSDPATFTRACRRWTGATPSQLRGFEAR